MKFPSLRNDTLTYAHFDYMKYISVFVLNMEIVKPKYQIYHMISLTKLF